MYKTVGSGDASAIFSTDFVLCSHYYVEKFNSMHNKGKYINEILNLNYKIVIQKSALAFFESDSSSGGVNGQRTAKAPSFTGC